MGKKALPCHPRQTHSQEGESVPAWHSKNEGTPASSKRSGPSTIEREARMHFRGSDGLAFLLPGRATAATTSAWSPSIPIDTYKYSHGGGGLILWNHGSAADAAAVPGGYFGDGRFFSLSQQQQQQEQRRGQQQEPSKLSPTTTSSLKKVREVLDFLGSCLSSLRGATLRKFLRPVVRSAYRSPSWC